MSSLSAFHGNPELRAAALQRLAAHVEAGRLTAGPLVWNGEKGSVAGCLIESAEPLTWERQLGLARWLAQVLDVVTDHLPSAVALQKTEAILNAIPLGGDTAALGGEVIAGLLEAMVGDDAAPLPPAMANSLGQVAWLHRRTLAGESLDASQWKIVRRTALAMTESLDASGPARERMIGGAIEAAAWDPRKSATVVADVLRQWLALERLNADSEFGWTEADDAEIRRLLARMDGEFLQPFPGETRDVFTLLEEHHPDEADRLRAYMQFGRDYDSVCAARAADMLSSLLSSAS